jgi:DNA-binding transcriptional ArsR family regulator
MGAPLERARAYLAQLEVDRQAALALSEQKAEEAGLLKARQEGFQAALRLLSVETSAGDAASGEETGALSADRRGRDERLSDPQEPHRRGRRPIRQLIARELSFSGQPMKAAQIARAIDYNPAGTERTLERMEQDGQVVRNEEGQWVIGTSTATKPNGHAVNGNGKLELPAEC